MGWNHRILVTEEENLVDGSTYEYFQLHEVYYDDDGIPDGATKNPITIGAETFGGIEWTVDKIKECLEKPILWGDDKFPQEYKKK
jgi:hypothetical protein